MKLLKKFSKGIIAVVLCLLLATTALAAATVTYTATLEDDVLCVGELTAAKTVTLTAKVDEKVLMDAFTAQVKVPEGWEITDIANDNLNFGEDNFNLANGMILWYAQDAENVEDNDLLATVTIQVPAGTPAGEYEIEFEIIDISRDWGMPWEDGEILTAKLTITDHVGGTATCKDKAVCAECGQPYGDVDKNNHTGEVVYTNNGDTHSAVYDCCGAVYVTDEAHDFSNGDCACGEAKPEDPTDPSEPDVPGTGLKGDVDLDGDVDMADLVAMARHIGEVEEITNAQSYMNADINSDGEIGMDDLVKLAQYVGEVIDSLD